MGEKYVVDGYCFKSQEEAAVAINEIEGIEYLRSRTNLKKPQNVLSVYDKIIDKELFKTPIGYGFLRELQQILYNSSEIEPEKIRSIPVASADEVKENKTKKSRGSKKKKLYLLPEEQEKKYKNKITNLIILNVLLVIALVVIIIITNNSDNTNILNYRERLEREYNEKEDELAVWDGQLKEKEQKLNEREKNMIQDNGTTVD